MKILLFANTSWYLYNFRLPLARALRERGHEVILIVPPDDFSPRLEQDGFRLIRFPFSRRGMNPAGEIKTIFRLFSIYRKEKPDIVHHFTIKCVIYGSISAKLAQIPGVINAITGLGYIFIGQSIFHTLIRPLIRILYRFTLRDSQIIFQNNDDLDYFTRQGMADRKKCELVPGSGVDIQKFTPLPFPDGDPVIILPARLLWDKGVAEFVEAARELKKEFPKTRFVLAGDVDPHNPATVPPDYLRQNESSGVIEWWGWQEDMLNVYAQSHIICLPSYREGIPRSLVEGAACGRPVVTTDVPGCRDVVLDGENGLLVPLRDVKALVVALRFLIANPEIRAKMGKKGIRMVAEKFSLDRVLFQTLAVYDKINRKNNESGDN